MISERSKGLVKCFYTGIVPEIAEAVIEQRKRDWAQLKLERKQKLIDEVTKKAIARRGSMAENATRCNYLFAGLAFIMGAGVTVMLFVSTSTASQIVLQVSASVILFATSILLFTIAAKGKVMRKNPEYSSEADAMLTRELAAQKHDETTPEMALYHEYEIAAFRLHKRKIILLAERRAQRVATHMAVLGLLTMIVGFNIR